MHINYTKFNYKCVKCGEFLGSTIKSDKNPFGFVFFITFFPFFISYLILRDYFDFIIPKYIVCNKCGIAYKIDEFTVSAHSISDMQNDNFYKHKWFFCLFYFIGGISIISLLLGIFSIEVENSIITILSIVIFIVTFISVVMAVRYWKKEKYN